ncbi:unnamed protein product [Chondrus crispus]|uniref:Uncharacterized protein n=1 Tax=Chondrus crispus TaxID=2769 RepID=R7QAB7_CHOCR|nr:unnamed protein product [Chondrus crispus]CDF34366.1 unnamed protein product [Chondrus crispus]|eukprot:XP_005714185.1 unnamed protein product [Chondrus crispus]
MHTSNYVNMRPGAPVLDCGDACGQPCRGYIATPRAVRARAKGSAQRNAEGEGESSGRHCC